MHPDNASLRILQEEVILSSHWPENVHPGSGYSVRRGAYALARLEPNESRSVGHQIMFVAVFGLRPMYGDADGPCIKPRRMTGSY